MKPTDKHFRCDICQRGFTRIDHLKRHHLRHSGQKPYSCIFCNSSFARCDNLRDHYTDCTKRGDRKIPETGQRGRRRHACQSCTSMKLRCDGQSPCGACLKRNIVCNNRRMAGPTHHGIYEETSVKSEIYPGPSSDRGSIEFLLNSGTDSFTETFRLPPRSDRTLSLQYHNRCGLDEIQRTGISDNIEGGQPEDDFGFLNSGQTTPHFFQETFLSLFNSSFGDEKKSMEGYHHNNDIVYRTFHHPEQNNPLILPDNPPRLEPTIEPERPFAVALIQSILTRIWHIIEPKVQEEVSVNIHFLLTTARIRKYIKLYFKYWQPNCAMLEISFDPETAPLPLLAAVAFMGAIYSTDERETYVAKRVLDFAELFIFSSNVFLAESEICTVFSGGQSCDDERTDWVRFQNLQAGFIIVIVQYWAGNRMARNRAIENRFSEVVKVARRMELFKARHLSSDQPLEHLWIQKECRIRTIAIISLLDCAFLFYQNYPCRLTLVEMECDLPCDESLFSSKHPFAEPNFCFSRGLQISEAFDDLFEVPGSKHMDFTTLDMFILIHLLYSFINTHMTLLGPFTRKDYIKQQSAEGSSKNTTQAPDDSIKLAIRTALSRWRDYWVTLRNRVSNDEWASMGFYKNGYNVWLVSQVLITKKDAVDVVMRMELNCEDKLEKLKVLLVDDQEDL